VTIKRLHTWWAFLPILLFAAINGTMATAAESPDVSLSSCALDWNRRASFGQQSTIARKHIANAIVLQRARTATPTCVLFFIGQRAMYRTTRLMKNGQVSWSAVVRVTTPTPPPGIPAVVDALTGRIVATLRTN
jgi:hypothetical protein